MASITIDGENKIIDIGYDSATTVVTAADIYSRWKDWVQSEGAWSEEAFALSVGGNDLGGGVALDAYYFIRNDLGWRIRAADQDHTLRIEGQLFPQAAGTEYLLARAGRTIRYVFFQSSRSQVVDPISTDWQTAALYGDSGVIFDPLSGSSGSSPPYGTTTQPVNNMNDAVTIAQSLGLRTITCLGDFTLNENVSGYELRGANKGILCTVNMAANVLNTLFNGLDVTGYFDGPAFVRGGNVDNIIDGFVGEIDDCHITTGITCIGGVNLHRCSSGQPWQGAAYLDMDGGAHACQVREYSGSIEVRGMVAGSTLSVNLNAGRLIVDSSCTGGSIKLVGVGEALEDNSGGAVTIDQDGYLNKQQIANLITPHIWGSAE